MNCPICGGPLEYEQFEVPGAFVVGNADQLQAVATWLDRVSGQWQCKNEACPCPWRVLATKEET